MLFISLQKQVLQITYIHIDLLCMTVSVSKNKNNLYLLINPVDTGRKLNVLCTFNLRPVSTGKASFYRYFCLTPIA